MKTVQDTIAVVKTLRFGNRSLARVAAAHCLKPEFTTTVAGRLQNCGSMTGNRTAIVIHAILNSMQMKSQVFNTDCLAAMREMPDNAFDLAVVDPPYGAGFTEGGCKGWFSKYHEDSSQTVKVERERESLEQIRRQIRQVQVSTINGRTAENRTGRGVLRTGGTWATKYAKKLFRGTWRRNRNILRSCFASHAIR